MIRWSTELPCPDFLSLKSCKTHSTLFAQLKRLMPSEVEDREIGAASIVLARPSKVYFDEDPSCRIHASELGQEAFKHVRDVLKRHGSDLHPMFIMTVEWATNGKSSSRNTIE